MMHSHAILSVPCHVHSFFIFPFVRSLTSPFSGFVPLPSVHTHPHPISRSLNGGERVKGMKKEARHEFLITNLASRPLSHIPLQTVSQEGEVLMEKRDTGGSKARMWKGITLQRRQVPEPLDFSF